MTWRRRRQRRSCPAPPAGTDVRSRWIMLALTVFVALATSAVLAAPPTKAVRSHTLQHDASAQDIHVGMGMAAQEGVLRGNKAGRMRHSVPAWVSAGMSPGSKLATKVREELPKVGDGVSNESIAAHGEFKRSKVGKHHYEHALAYGSGVGASSLWEMLPVPGTLWDHRSEPLFVANHTSSIGDSKNLGAVLEEEEEEEVGLREMFETMKSMWGENADKGIKPRPGAGRLATGIVEEYMLASVFDGLLQLSLNGPATPDDHEMSVLTPLITGGDLDPTRDPPSAMCYSTEKLRGDRPPTLAVEFYAKCDDSEGVSVVAFHKDPAAQVEPKEDDTDNKETVALGSVHVRRNDAIQAQAYKERFSYPQPSEAQPSEKPTVFRVEVGPKCGHLKYRADSHEVYQRAVEDGLVDAAATTSASSFIFKHTALVKASNLDADEPYAHFRVVHSGTRLWVYVNGKQAGPEVEAPRLEYVGAAEKLCVTSPSIKMLHVYDSIQPLRTHDYGVHKAELKDFWSTLFDAPMPLKFWGEGANRFDANIRKIKKEVVLHSGECTSTCGKSPFCLGVAYADGSCHYDWITTDVESYRVGPDTRPWPAVPAGRGAQLWRKHGDWHPRRKPLDSVAVARERNRDGPPADSRQETTVEPSVTGEVAQLRLPSLALASSMLDVGRFPPFELIGKSVETFVELNGNQIASSMRVEEFVRAIETLVGRTPNEEEESSKASAGDKAAEDSKKKKRFIEAGRSLLFGIAKGMMCVSKVLECAMVKARKESNALCENPDSNDFDACYRNNHITPTTLELSSDTQTKDLFRHVSVCSFVTQDLIVRGRAIPPLEAPFGRKVTADGKTTSTGGDVKREPLYFNWEISDGGSSDRTFSAVPYSDRRVPRSFVYEQLGAVLIGADASLRLRPTRLNRMLEAIVDVFDFELMLGMAGRARRDDISLCEWTLLQGLVMQGPISLPEATRPDPFNLMFLSRFASIIKPPKDTPSPEKLSAENHFRHYRLDALRWGDFKTAAKLLQLVPYLVVQDKPNGDGGKTSHAMAEQSMGFHRFYAQKLHWIGQNAKKGSSGSKHHALEEDDEDDEDHPGQFREDPPQDAMILALPKTAGYNVMGFLVSLMTPTSGIDEAKERVSGITFATEAFKPKDQQRETSGSNGNDPVLMSAVDEALEYPQLIVPPEIKDQLANGKFLVGMSTMLSQLMAKAKDNEERMVPLEKKFPDEASCKRNATTTAINNSSMFGKAKNWVSNAVQSVKDKLIGESNCDATFSSVFTSPPSKEFTHIKDQTGYPSSITIAAALAYSLLAGEGEGGSGGYAKFPAHLESIAKHGSSEDGEYWLATLGKAWNALTTAKEFGSPARRPTFTEWLAWFAKTGSGLGLAFDGAVGAQPRFLGGVLEGSHMLVRFDKPVNDVAFSSYRLSVTNEDACGTLNSLSKVPDQNHQLKKQLPYCFGALEDDAMAEFESIKAPSSTECSETVSQREHIWPCTRKNIDEIEMNLKTELSFDGWSCEEKPLSTSPQPSYVWKIDLSELGKAGDAGPTFHLHYCRHEKKLGCACIEGLPVAPNHPRIKRK